MSLLKLLEEIPDPRESWKVKHSLSTVLFVTLCAVLCGAESWSDIGEFCIAKYAWLNEYVSFEQGIPSEWTFRRVFSLLDPLKLEGLLRAHAQSLMKEKSERQIAIDGKALRGSKRKKSGGLQSISAVCHESGLTLAASAVEEKSSETSAIPFLLDVLELKKNTVTIDAAGCQQSIAQGIIQKKGEHVFSLKKNHPKFYEQVSRYCQKEAITPEHCLKDDVDDSHGRCVRRRYFACDIRHLEGAQKWPGIRSGIAVETIQRRNPDSAVVSQWRYYISSHCHTQTNLPSMIRHHWSIENKLHWTLDVHLHEDNDRKAERKSAMAFALLKRIALNIVRTKDNNPKRSLRRRFKRAGWDNQYLMRLLIE